MPYEFSLGVVGTRSDDRRRTGKRKLHRHLDHRLRLLEGTRPITERSK